MRVAHRLSSTPCDSDTLEPDAQLDEYRETRAALRERMAAAVAKGDAPSVVAEVVLKAAEAARPQLRYTAGPLAGRLRLLRRFAPVGLVDGGVRKSLALDTLPAPRTASLA